MGGGVGGRQREAPPGAGLRQELRVGGGWVAGRVTRLRYPAMAKGDTFLTYHMKSAFSIP